MRIQHFGWFALFPSDLLFHELRSQGPDRTVGDGICRSSDAITRGISAPAPTITPGGRFWLRRRSRWLTLPERAALQGISHLDAAVAMTNMQELVGQAMCAGSMIPALVAMQATRP